VLDDSFTVYPNPSQSIVNIKSAHTIESVELYDVQGRILEKRFENSDTVIIDLSNRDNGIYFLKITSEKGSKVEKVVKN
jgi:Secretion system C-terminal sorting domain